MVNGKIGYNILVCIIICLIGQCQVETYVGQVETYGLVLYNLEKSKSIKRTNKEQSMFYHIDIFSLTHLYYSFVGHHRQQQQQQQQQTM